MKFRMTGKKHGTNFIDYCATDMKKAGPVLLNESSGIIRNYKRIFGNYYSFPICASNGCTIDLAL